MSLQLLKATPDVRLDVLHHMAKVNRAIGIRQGAGDQNFAARAAHRKNTVNECEISRTLFHKPSKKTATVSKNLISDAVGGS
jgi:hypothetical protein